METGHTDELRRRAAKHAALSDPARLAIVDSLTLGDASPSELQSLLAMPSNLLAHHVKVLEREGILTRKRSEADRRRSYLGLVPSALDGLLPGVTRTAERLIFVCTGNSARSPLAAALWRHASRIPAASAGIQPAERIDPGAVATARRHGLPLRIQRPRPLGEVLTGTELIITVCDNAHEELGESHALHWSVSDPVGVGTAAAFDAAFTDLSRRVTDLVPRLTAS